MKIPFWEFSTKSTFLGQVHYNTSEHKTQVVFLANDTTLRNTLYKELLTEQVNDEQGGYYQQNTGANHGLTEVTGVVQVTFTVYLQQIQLQRQGWEGAALQEQ